MKVYFGLSGGGLKIGSMAAGLVAELGRQGRLHDVKTTAACSVNVYLGAYLTAEHPTKDWDRIEEFWRNKVHGEQLYSPRKKPKMNLDSLDHAFRTGETKLDTEEFDRQLAQGRSVLFALTDRETGLPVYVQPSGKNVLDWAKQALSIPRFYDPPGRYTDGGFATENIPLSPVLKRNPEGKIEFSRDYDEIWVMTNFPPNPLYAPFVDLGVSLWMAPTFPKPARPKIKEHRKNLQTSNRMLEEIQMLQIKGLWKGPRVRWIKPPYSHVKRLFDTDKRRINQNVDLGIQMAKEFARTA